MFWSDVEQFLQNRSSNDDSDILSLISNSLYCQKANIQKREEPDVCGTNGLTYVIRVKGSDHPGARNQTSGIVPCCVSVWMPVKMPGDISQSNTEQSPWCDGCLNEESLAAIWKWFAPAFFKDIFGLLLILSFQWYPLQFYSFFMYLCPHRTQKNDFCFFSTC